MKQGMFVIKGCKPLSFSLDTLARALYITFSNNPVEKTIRKNSSFSMDYDKEGHLVGIEIIHLKNVTTAIKQFIKESERIVPSQYREAVKGLDLTCV